MPSDVVGEDFIGFGHGKSRKYPKYVWGKSRNVNATECEYLNLNGDNFHYFTIRAIIFLAKNAYTLPKFSITDTFFIVRMTASATKYGSFFVATNFAFLQTNYRLFYLFYIFTLKSCETHAGKTIACEMKWNIVHNDALERV